MSDDAEDVEKQTLSEVERKLAKADPNVFEGIPEPKKEQIIATIVKLQHKTHVGPLPDAETLRSYSEIIPNGADRIMAMAERQMAHRMEIENQAVTRQLNQSSTGQWLAFSIGLAALGSATYCIIEGHEWAGSIVGTGGIIGLVTAFIKGKDFQQKDLAAKRQGPK